MFTRLNLILPVFKFAMFITDSFPVFAMQPYQILCCVRSSAVGFDTFWLSIFGRESLSDAWIQSIKRGTYPWKQLVPRIHPPFSPPDYIWLVIELSRAIGIPMLDNTNHYLYMSFFDDRFSMYIFFLSKSKVPILLRFGQIFIHSITSCNSYRCVLPVSCSRRQQFSDVKSTA